MSNTSATIVQRLWNYCNVLRDDGVSYGDYVEQLTYLLFLKMADEQVRELGKSSGGCRLRKKWKPSSRRVFCDDLRPGAGMCVGLGNTLSATTPISNASGNTSRPIRRVGLTINCIPPPGPINSIEAKKGVRPCHTVASSRGRAVCFRSKYPFM